MGFSSPKAVKQEPAPPPVTTTSADTAYAEQQARKKQANRHGYVRTQTASRSLLSGKPAETFSGKKTYLT